MKILKEKYPKGTFKYQKSDGRFMDGYLHENLSVLADRILDDMTFLGVCFSSTLEVGTGKSVLCTQIGEAWSELMKEKHNIDVPFTKENVVFKPKDLIERSFKVPKYSCILLDEWEDSHYWSELAKTLRQFFRKCRQLNLFIIVVIPNFFQLPMSYAISRSVFAIDVKFEDKFERGYFNFYSFQRKKDLYVKGKKFYNYNVVKPNFDGRFMDGYGVDEKEYRAAKLRDMMDYDSKDKILTPKDVEIARVKKIKEKRPDIMNKDLAEMFEVSDRTIGRWLKVGEEGKSILVLESDGEKTNYTTLPNNKESSDGGGETNENQ